MPRLMTRNAGRTMMSLAGVAMAVSAVAILPSLPDLLLFVVIGAIFTAPGWPLAAWVAGSDAGRLTRAILALPLGYFAGAITTCLLRLIGVSSPFIVLPACLALTALLIRVCRQPQPGVVSLAPLEPRDRVALAVLWLVAIAIVGPVFARVGEATPAGLAYRAYFNADLFAHMSVVAELAKGATPPRNPFYPVEALPYYWTYFTLPGLFSHLRPELPVDPGIMLTDLTTAVIFVSVGFLVLRSLGASTTATAIAWLVILLASSFEGSYFLWQQSALGRPIDEFRVTNIDAITRWVWNLPGVDGLHRAMWWTPQHLMALTLALIVVLTTVRARRPHTAQPAVLDGLLLGGILAFSSFNGVILIAWYALMHIVAFAIDRGRNVVQWLLSRSITAVLALLFLGLTLGLGIVQLIPGSFIFGWNRYFLRGPWTFYLLSFGPALFLAPLGLLAVRRASRTLLIAIVTLIVVSTLVFLQLDLRGHENTQVTFRTGHILYLCLAVLLAFAIDAWRAWPKALAATLAIVLLAASVAATPTVALDWYNARDISNVEMNPGGFPWTVHINPDDQAAVRWIQVAMPRDATIQADAGPRDRNSWAFIPAFARRRMPVGNGIFLLNPGRHTNTFKQIHEAFATRPAEEAHAYFKTIGADYVYVGDVERNVAAGGVAKFASRPDLFERAFRRGTVEIFRIVK